MTLLFFLNAGHGNTKNLKTPKIVEALLGDDIKDIATGDNHVAVVTSDGEVATKFSGDLTLIGQGSWMLLHCRGG